jgi:hypothetical protein
VTTELHVHDWTPWHPLAVIEGVPWRRRICPGCASTQDEPTPAVRETPAGMESAIEAGAKALHHAEWTDGGFRELDAETCWAQDPDDHAGYYEQARILAAAAVPHIERAIRAEVAAEINLLDYPFDADSTRLDVVLECVRIALGEAAT